MKALQEAARTLHANYGKGDIQEVRFYVDGRVEIHAKRTSCKPHIAKGRLINRKTVKLYGHRLTVKEET
jgi:hypothetical protein